MDSLFAKKLLETLADGVNPITGEVLPETDSCNQPDIIRALNLAVKELDRASKRSRNLPKNAGKPWTEEDDKALSQLYDGGLSIVGLSERFSRSPGAISSRLARLGKHIPEYRKSK